jgi:hypothetical protein
MLPPLPTQRYCQAAAAAAKVAATPTLPPHFLVVFNPVIAVVAGVFIATAAAHGGRQPLPRSCPPALPAGSGSLLAVLPPATALPAINK